MLLLVTGGSGVGKSTARATVAPALSPQVESVELWDLAPVSARESMSLVWRQRLASRGDDPALLVHHQAFADWMRRQAGDPLHMPHVASEHGWERMRWDRLPRLVETWSMQTIDTSDLSRAEVADAVLRWCRRALAGTAPTLRLSDDQEGPLRSM